MKPQIPNPKSQGRTTKATKRTKKIYWVTPLTIFVIFVTFVVSTDAQQLLDRVVARVGSSSITQTDVDAAVTFGIVNRGDALKGLIERRLILAEVDRLPPAEPIEADVMELVAKMRATAGANAAAMMKRTGTDDKRLTELARDTLRIQSYMRQRFGSGPRAEEQRSRWLVDIRTRGDVTVMSPQP